MGSIIVGIILLAVILNAFRMLHKQKKRMKDWKCTGDCDTCKMPCQAKRIYHKDDSASN